MRFRVGPDFPRPSADLLGRFVRSSPATLGHLTDFGFPRGLRRVGASRSFAGPALTVRIPHLDSTAVHRAMGMIRPGDVVVIDQSGDTDRSSFGGTLAGIAGDAGAAAVVSDGGTNDVDEVSGIDLPLYSRGATPLTTRILSLEGEINLPVSVGGVAVLPGDVVFGDADGVAVVRAADAEAVADELDRLEEKLLRADLRGRVRSGTELAVLTGAYDQVGVRG